MSSATAWVSSASLATLSWPEEPDETAKGAWNAKDSDHAILRFTVTGVR